MAEIRTVDVRSEQRRGHVGIDRRRARIVSRATADRAGEELCIACLSTEETDPAQSEISKLEVTVLVDEQIIGFKITGEREERKHRAHDGASLNQTYRCTIPR